MLRIFGYKLKTNYNNWCWKPLKVKISQPQLKIYWLL